MKKWYKKTGVLLLGVYAMTQVHAQTHYGVGAGTQGSNHSFFGTNAGHDNTSGGSNSFFGHSAGSNNKSGNDNVFVGAHAGTHTYTSGNVFIGSNAGIENGAGELNTFLGSYSGQQNFEGNGNLFAGYSTGSANLVGNYNTFLGTQSATLNNTGSENVFVGYKSGTVNAVGNFNVFLGSQSGKNCNDGSSNTYVGYMTDGADYIQNATAIGANAKVMTDNSLVLGYKANVGIGISAPSFQLHLSTDAAAKPGSPDWLVASDSRLKKNITNFTDGLELLKQIRPVWFQYNGEAGIETGDKKFVGIVAQEMQKIAPYTIGRFIHQDSLGNKTEYLDYDANAVTYILINSVKEQQRIIEDKEAKIQALESRLEKLERLVNVSPGIFDKQPDGGALEQNVPNGFSTKTSIKYFIPHSVKKAVIDVYTVAGVKVSSHPISERGAGELVLSADKYRSEVHVYDLVMDGKSLGAKKMVVE